MLDHYEMNFFFSSTSVIDLWESFSLPFSMKKLQTPINRLLYMIL